MSMITIVLSLAALDFALRGEDSIPMQIYKSFKEQKESSDEFNSRGVTS